MKKYFFPFLFGHQLGESKWLNTGWLLFRLHMGLSIAIHAGFPKMKDIAAPGWFSDQVAGLGFTWPSPAFWAATASWGEFIGGICIALGLLTRFSALQLAFQFFVISFLWYDKPEPLTGMYFQQTLFFGYVLIAFAGGGTFSLDHLIMKRRKLHVTVPLKTAIASLLLLTGLGAHAQRSPLNGSGILINKEFGFKNFDKLEIKDLAGKIEVEVGKPFAVSIAIDDNLEPLLRVKEDNGVLEISLEGNLNNKLYIEETNIRIRIAMPEVSVINHRANSRLQVNGITGRYFRLKNSGNGNAFISGRVDELDIICRGNGTVRGEEMVAVKTTVSKSGNGNVYIKTDQSFTASGSGNGDIINTGAGKADPSSAVSGNGEIRYPQEADKEKQPVHKTKRVQVILKNETAQWVEYTVKYPSKGSYGIEVKPGESLKESFPVGTRLFKGNQFTIFKTPVYVVSDKEEQEFIITTHKK